MKRVVHSFIALLSSKYFTYFVIIWFTLLATYFALTIKFGLPPDENYHFTYIKLFAESNLTPFLSDIQGYHNLREVERNPFFLYHYILAFPYLLVEGLGNNYVYLRLINVVLGILSLLTVVKIAKALNISILASNITLFMLSNTVMFVFIFSSINYDNLFILLSLLAVLYLILLRYHLNAKNLLVLILVIAAGILVKVNFLPVAFISVIILVLIIKSPITALKTVKLSFKSNFTTNILLLAAIVTLGMISFERYGINLISYQSISPSCEMIRPIDECRKSGLYARNEVVFGKGAKPAELAVADYVFDWFSLMRDRTFAIYAHQRFEPNRYLAIGFTFFIFIGIAFIIRYWRPGQKELSILLVMIIFNVLVLIAENNRIYSESGRLQLAVHGRYLFGVLPLFFLLVNHYIVRHFTGRNVVLSIYAVVTILLFIASAIPSVIRKTDSQWYVNQYHNSEPSAYRFIHKGGV